MSNAGRSSGANIAAVFRGTPPTTDTDDTEDTLPLGATHQLVPNATVFGHCTEPVVPAPQQGDEPERGKTCELGFRYRPEGFRGIFTASIYDLTKYIPTITDAITLVLSTKPGQVWVTHGVARASCRYERHAVDRS